MRKTKKKYFTQKVERLGKMAIKTKGNWSTQTDNNGTQTKHKPK